MEDLSKEDRMAREALWPRSDQARKNGEKAYFRGPFGFINGHPGGRPGWVKCGGQISCLVSCMTNKDLTKLT